MLAEAIANITNVARGGSKATKMKPLIYEEKTEADLFVYDFETYKQRCGLRNDEAAAEFGLALKQIGAKIWHQELDEVVKTSYPLLKERFLETWDKS